MRSRCASMKRLPAMRRMMAAAAAQPTMIRNSLTPEGERRDQRGAEKNVREQAGGERRDRDRHDEAGERQGDVEPEQRGERRRRHQAGRRHLQHQHEIEAGQALLDAERQEQRAEHGRRDDHHPHAGGGDQARPGDVTAQFNRIDAQEGERQHHDDGFAEPGLDGGRERRHGEPDEDRGSRQQRAVAAGQAEQGRGQAEKLHVWKDSRLASLIAPRRDCDPYIRFGQGDGRGTHRCDRSGRRHCRHQRGAAPRQARAFRCAGRARGARRADLVRQCRHHRGQHGVPAGLSVRPRRAGAHRDEDGERGELSPDVSAQGAALAAGVPRRLAARRGWSRPRI